MSNDHQSVVNVSSSKQSPELHRDGSHAINRRTVLGWAAVSAVLTATRVPVMAMLQTSDRLELEAPAMVHLFVGDAEARIEKLTRQGDRWTGSTGDVTVTRTASRINIAVACPRQPLQRMHLRWRRRTPETVKVLGDAWERSYGELEWLPLRAERVLPWYCMLADGKVTTGFGVMVGAASLAFWQVDQDGISLWLDLRNGGSGTVLGERVLQAASLVSVHSDGELTAFECTRELCRRMAAGTAVPMQRGGANVRTVIGTNDWYYAYGKNIPANIVRDAELVQSLVPRGVRPFTIIDDGYQDQRRFPDMAALAKQIASIGPSPGLWIRPLRAAKSDAEQMLLPRERWGPRSNRVDTLAYDPTTPEGRAAALTVVTQAVGWGYRLLKHDFTTYELLGQWGNEMGPTPTVGNWHFHDRSRTNAEIIAAFYTDIRKAAGEDVVLQGCNTIGHLSVGLFDTSRIGDDVSGRDWERTRRMGTNTLPFRLPQHGTFFCVDPDCLPITGRIPWNLTRQWLHAIASTGSTLILSAEPDAVGPEQRAVLKDELARCAAVHTPSVPLDWMQSPTPTQWSGEARPYEWKESEGASPFSISQLIDTGQAAGSMMVSA